MWIFGGIEVGDGVREFKGFGFGGDGFDGKIWALFSRSGVQIEWLFVCIKYIQ